MLFKKLCRLSVEYYIKFGNNVNCTYLNLGFDRLENNVARSDLQYYALSSLQLLSFALVGVGWCWFDLLCSADAVKYDRFRNFIVFFLPKPWHIEIRHRVEKTFTIN